jgi:hypothetical protein
MMIDGYDLIDGERVMMRSKPTRWDRFVHWVRAASGRPESIKANGVYTVSIGGVYTESVGADRREPKWLKPTLFNRAFVWLLAAVGDHRYGILYDFGD